MDRRFGVTAMVGSFVALVAVASASLVLLGAEPAAACSCVSSDDADAFDRADAVFVATLERRVEPQSNFSAAHAELTMAVDRVFKGDVAPAQRVVTEASGASCGLELQGAGPFLVFADTSAFDHEKGELAELQGDTLYAGLCGGTRPVGAGVPAAFGAGSAAGNVADTVADGGSGTASPDDSPDSTGPTDRSDTSDADSGGWSTERSVGLVVFAAGGAGIGILYGRRRRRERAAAEATEPSDEVS